MADGNSQEHMTDRTNCLPYHQEAKEEEEEEEEEEEAGVPQVPLEGTPAMT
jgi:hypothetical protein